MSNEPTRCQRCPQMVRFIQMMKKDGSRGSLAPVDHEPSPNGNIHLVGDVAEVKGYVLTGENLEQARRKEVRLYINHFATCPKAQQFRKAK